MTMIIYVVLSLIALFAVFYCIGKFSEWRTTEQYCHASKMAKKYEEEGALDEAEHYHRLVHKLSPDIFSIKDLAQFLYEKKSNLEEAKSLYHQLIDMYDVKLVNNKITNHETGEQEDNLMLVVGKARDAVEPLGRVYHSLGELDKAEHYYRESLDVLLCCMDVDRIKDVIKIGNKFNSGRLDCWLRDIDRLENLYENLLNVLQHKGEEFKANAILFDLNEVRAARTEVLELVET